VHTTKALQTIVCDPNGIGKARLHRNCSNSYSDATESFFHSDGDSRGQSSSKVGINCHNCGFRCTGTEYYFTRDNKPLCNGCFHENERRDQRLQLLIAELINKDLEDELKGNFEKEDNHEASICMKDALALEKSRTRSDKQVDTHRKVAEDKFNRGLSELKHKKAEAKAHRKDEVSARLKATIAGEEARKLAHLLNQQDSKSKLRVAERKRENPERVTFSQTEAPIKLGKPTNSAED
jgi:hypothetical protein